MRRAPERRRRRRRGRQSARGPQVRDLRRHAGGDARPAISPQNRRLAIAPASTATT